MHEKDTCIITFNKTLSLKTKGLTRDTTYKSALYYKSTHVIMKPYIKGF